MDAPIVRVSTTAAHRVINITANQNWVLKALEHPLAERTTVNGVPILIHAYWLRSAKEVGIHLLRFGLIKFSRVAWWWRLGIAILSFNNELPVSTLEQFDELLPRRLPRFGLVLRVFDGNGIVQINEVGFHAITLCLDFPMAHSSTISA